MNALLNAIGALLHILVFPALVFINCALEFFIALRYLSRYTKKMLPYFKKRVVLTVFKYHLACRKLVNQLSFQRLGALVSFLKH